MHLPTSGWLVQRRDAPTESPAPEFSAAGTVNHPTEEPLSPSITPIGQVLAVEDDDEELPSDLDDLFADAEPSGEGVVTPRLVDNDVEGEEPLVSKPTGEEECQPQRMCAILACHRKRTSMSMRPVVTARTALGARHALKVEVLVRLTGAESDRSPRSPPGV